MEYTDVARVLTDLLGRTISDRPISMEDAQSQMEAAGLPPEQIEAMLAIASYQKAGGPTSTISDKIERILGRPPRTIRDFLRDHAGHFGN